jgi:hypothetical protein
VSNKDALVQCNQIDLNKVECSEYFEGKKFCIDPEITNFNMLKEIIASEFKIQV